MQELAVVRDRRPLEHAALALAVEMPGHDVGVVLHDREHDLVALAEIHGAVGAGDEVDALGGVAREDDLLDAWRIEEAAHRLARVLVAGGGGVGEEVQPAMDVGVFHLVGVVDGVEHRARLLRRGAVVEIDQRLAVDLAEQDREVGADGLDVVGGLARDVGFFRHCRHVRPPPLRCARLACAESAASRRLAMPANASRTRSSSTLSMASPMKLSISSARASVRRNAARAHVEEQVLVELGCGRAVAADHVVGVDLELGLGIELGVLRQHERLGHLLAVALLRIGAHDHLALEDAARPVGQHALEQLAAHAAGHGMVDHQRGVDVLGAAAEEQRRRCRAWRPRP